jgi:hypothetical protein
MIDGFDAYGRPVPPEGEAATLALVPTDLDFARVGLFTVAQKSLDLQGLLQIFGEAAEDDRLFQMLTAMAETFVRKLHLREDAEAFTALVHDLNNYQNRADNNNGKK